MKNELGGVYWRQRRWRRASAGSLTVEMAIIAPLLVLLLLGTIEMGLVVKDSLVVGSASREAARSAAVGATIAEIVEVARAAAPTLNVSALTIEQAYRTCVDGIWSAWTPLTDAPPRDAKVENVAPSRAQVRITLAYPHSLVTGSMFASMATPGTNSVHLQSSIVVTRE